jgi:hypothetical protein
MYVKLTREKFKIYFIAFPAKFRNLYNKSTPFDNQHQWHLLHMYVCSACFSSSQCSPAASNSPQAHPWRCDCPSPGAEFMTHVKLKLAKNKHVMWVLWLFSSK